VCLIRVERRRTRVAPKETAKMNHPDRGTAVMIGAVFALSAAALGCTSGGSNSRYALDYVPPDGARSEQVLEVATPTAETEPSTVVGDEPRDGCRVTPSATGLAAQFDLKRDRAPGANGSLSGASRPADSRHAERPAPFVGDDGHGLANVNGRHPEADRIPDFAVRVVLPGQPVLPPQPRYSDVWE
jgi:hypothetical protein